MQRWISALAGALPVLLIAGADRARSPMSEPLALVAKAKAAFSKVDDYSCVLIKRETLEGKLTPNHVISMKMKTKPFSVHLRWQEPKKLEGQEVCYVVGKNDGKMRAKVAGLLGAIGFISLAVDDARAKQASRHPISRAGLGYVIERCEVGWKAELDTGTLVRTGPYTYAKRRCTRVEVIYAKRQGTKHEHARNVVYFDEATSLPIRAECYAWPKKPGDKEELDEVYSYINLRLNVGLRDEDFKK